MSASLFFLFFILQTRIQNLSAIGSRWMEFNQNFIISIDRSTISSQSIAIWAKFIHSIADFFYIILEAIRLGYKWFTNYTGQNKELLVFIHTPPYVLYKSQSEQFDRLQILETNFWYEKIHEILLHFL